MDIELETIASELRATFSMKRATDALFLKRDAFDYEAEVRAIAFLQPKMDEAPPKSLRVQINPHAFVDSILFDPRADTTYVKMATHFLKSALAFDGPIARSVLYKATAINIHDDT